MTLTPATLLLFVLLVMVNLLTYTLYRVDKHRAKTHSRRIPEAALLFLSACGGAAGAICGMYLTRHKTRHLRFVILNPLLLLLQLYLLYIILS